MDTKLIIALDVNTFQKAKKFVDLLYPKIKIFKVGLQLFTVCGPAIIDYINKKGAEVFLDLKLFDIPNTVKNAVASLAALNVKMLTLHIQGGKDMIRAAVQAKNKELLLIGVTVLTSQEATKEEVLQLAKAGIRAGLDGVVCSVKEAGFLRENIKKQFVIVTPGIRPKGFGSNDQKRVATYQDAKNAGSNFVVIGRPILEAGDPLAAIESLLSS